MNDAIAAWLRGDVCTSANGRYRHRLLLEQVDARLQAVAVLRPAVGEAYDDVKRHLAWVAGVSLDPLETTETVNPAQGFPSALTMNGLKGHFGEFFAGVIAEVFRPLGEDGWRVPAYLFRFHLTAYFELERARDTGEAPREAFGRIGSDCLAFQLRDGRVAKCLVCEAKCTAGHNAGLIADAHTTLSNAPQERPVDLSLVIEVLLSRQPDADTAMWVEALRRLWLARSIPAGYERCDMVTYICRETSPPAARIQPRTVPHSQYTVGRRLEAVEVQLNAVEDLIRALYGEAD